MAETPLTDKGYFISRYVKKSIVLNLCEMKSMSLIAREHVVSPTTVLRVLHSLKLRGKEVIYQEYFQLTSSNQLKELRVL